MMIFSGARGFGLVLRRVRGRVGVSSTASCAPGDSILKGLQMNVFRRVAAAAATITAALTCVVALAAAPAAATPVRLRAAPPVVGPSSSATSSGWAIQKTPNPAGGTGSQLLGVSCKSTSACIAVGDHTNSTGTSTLAERWNGTKWVIQKIPNPAGGGQLFGVSCTSASACIAVGGSAGTLAERWNGTKWVIQKTPNPTGATSSELRGVSCTSASACTAVGDYTTNAVLDATLAERWNGTKWAIQKTPNPAGVSELDGVSCTLARACTAVGLTQNSTGLEVSLAERWNGTKWVVQKTPNPAGASGTFLNGVSCTSASACTAVGDYFPPGTDITATLAERWNGTKWVVQKTPTPAGTTTSELLGVACTSASVCTAAGDYTNSAGATVTLAERWNGTKWAIQKTPNPPGATGSQLNGASCTSARACTAVGNSVNSANRSVTLAERHS